MARDGLAEGAVPGAGVTAAPWSCTISTGLREWAATAPATQPTRWPPRPGPAAGLASTSSVVGLAPHRPGLPSWPG